jgi:hypothetical protein
MHLYTGKQSVDLLVSCLFAKNQILEFNYLSSESYGLTIYSKY